VQSVAGSILCRRSRYVLIQKRSSTHRFLQGFRIASQILFFLFFLWLLLQTHFAGKDSIGAVEGFFRFDPLLAITTLFASRKFVLTFLFALGAVILTAAFGRYLCGWVCPMGALLQFFSFIFKKSKLHVPKLQDSRLLSLKYAILAVVLVASLFALDFAGFLDPLSLLYRSFVLAVLPSAADAGDKLLSALPGAGLSAVRESLAQHLQNLTINRTFHQALLIGLIFLGLLLLNLWRERFWCRYLCPAGALLGMLARRNIVKLRVDTDKCVKCNLCTVQCQTQAAPHPEGNWKAAECVYCYTCAALCPTAAINTPIQLSHTPSRSVSLERRKWIFSAVFGLSLVPLFRISASARRPFEKLIRPPGALPEAQFISLCVKCGECMKVCPTNALQPALNQAGPEGLWTPVVVPRIGYCEYLCSLCTQVCPTGAIKELTVKEKARIRIGTAWVNKNRCLPYTLGETCNVCEEKCPTSPKAIKMAEMEMVLPDGTWAAQDVPVVNPDVCIGCGICETKCPVSDEPAIYCTNFGESRSAQTGPAVNT
jgi:MauM/NapG family ferredoxin protein